MNYFKLEILSVSKFFILLENSSSRCLGNILLFGKEKNLLDSKFEKKKILLCLAEENSSLREKPIINS